ncbi:fumarylacetoacetate hydrolase family protein [Kiritimatiellota bacterium B12222]|nr:fumarylacetoacetate hydrolase family protein [Kiritimatiellota bacterium B12222]
MKIARIQDSAQQIHVVTPSGDRWLRCHGDLEHGWTASEEEIVPVRFLPPVVPTTILGIGLNYRAHAEEMNSPLPEFPVVFAKSLNAACGHLDAVELPVALKSEMVDYEVEMAIVIGKTCKNVAPEQALEVIAGYTIGNDVSARDWQKIYGGGQWSRAKSFDTFCPLGPVMVTADEIADPNALALSMEINGERVQSSNTSDLIFNVQALISFLSGSTTLLAGTVILTGTPPGVGAGKTPPVYLKAGDVMEAEIAGIGRLRNPIIDEPTRAEQGE